MYCDGFKGRLRTTMIALMATGVGCMRTTRLEEIAMDLGHSRCCDRLRTIRVQ